MRSKSFVRRALRRGFALREHRAGLNNREVGEVLSIGSERARHLIASAKHDLERDNRYAPYIREILDA